MGPDLSRDERQRVVANLKGLALPITGTLGFEKAEVTAGGVALDEVDPKTSRVAWFPDFTLRARFLTSTA